MAVRDERFIVFRREPIGRFDSREGGSLRVEEAVIGTKTGQENQSCVMWNHVARPDIKPPMVSALVDLAIRAPSASERVGERTSLREDPALTLGALLEDPALTLGALIGSADVLAGLLPVVFDPGDEFLDVGHAGLE